MWRLSREGLSADGSCQKGRWVLPKGAAPSGFRVQGSGPNGENDQQLSADGNACGVGFTSWRMVGGRCLVVSSICHHPNYACTSPHFWEPASPNTYCDAPIQHLLQCTHQPKYLLPVDAPHVGCACCASHQVPVQQGVALGGKPTHLLARDLGPEASQRTQALHRTAHNLRETGGRSVARRA